MRSDRPDGNESAIPSGQFLNMFEITPESRRLLSTSPIAPIVAVGFADAAPTLLRLSATLTRVLPIDAASSSARIGALSGPGVTRAWYR